MSSPSTTALDGPAVEMEVAKDLVRRAAMVAPAVLVVCGLVWGLDGALSAAYALGIVIVNFGLAAVLLSTTARISLGLMMGAALFGYLLRLGLIFVAVWVVQDASWVELVPLGLTLILTHLGLLVWELRYVSASMAFPGLKPGAPAAQQTAEHSEKETTEP